MKLEVEVTAEVHELDDTDSDELADRIRDQLFDLLISEIAGDVIVMTVSPVAE